ncbi:hypothetical protein BLNAU_1340 [Blattamonas nauphoetae]|uniref:Uncharacterized protein n=1 Tax=Blattamonas nauphoetae TaxID=2049346 RepID=A0ABQ9YJ67_9EUKA|nr:hypothetical protein BLNAU_1340 [Blattamonas nauphoetae]
MAHYNHLHLSDPHLLFEFIPCFEIEIICTSLVDLQVPVDQFLNEYSFYKSDITEENISSLWQLLSTVEYASTINPVPSLFSLNDGLKFICRKSLSSHAQLTGKSVPGSFDHFYFHIPPSEKKITRPSSPPLQQKDSPSPTIILYGEHGEKRIREDLTTFNQKSLGQLSTSSVFVMTKDDGVCFHFAE